MSFTIPKAQVITYEPEDLRRFHLYGFEWIDNLHFLLEPSAILGDRATAYSAIASEQFLEAGWAGDGEIQLLWLPPFVFPSALRIAPTGIVLWHVK